MTHTFSHSFDRYFCTGEKRLVFQDVDGKSLNVSNEDETAREYYRGKLNELKSQIKGNLTVESLQATQKNIEELEKYSLSALEDADKADFQTVKDDLNLAIAQSPEIQEAVSDVLLPDENTPKSFTDQMKTFFKGIGTGAMGQIIKGFISFRRMWLSFFPPANPAEAEKQLQAIESLREKWFGIPETRDLITGVLQDNQVPIALVDGADDKIAYAKLKELWRKELKPKLDNEQSAELKSAVMEANTFENFVRILSKEYADMYQGYAKSQSESNKTIVVTLSGVFEKKRPIEGKAPDQSDQSQGFLSFFSLFSNDKSAPKTKRSS